MAFFTIGSEGWVELNRLCSQQAGGEDLMGDLLFEYKFRFHMTLWQSKTIMHVQFYFKSVSVWHASTHALTRART